MLTQSGRRKKNSLLHRDQRGAEGEEEGEEEEFSEILYARQLPLSAALAAAPTGVEALP